MYTIYKKHLYINPNYDYIKSGIIKEYDIHAAGLNMLIAANLLSDEQVKYYNSLEKKRRNIELGYLQKNKIYAKAISENLKKYRKLFFEENEIDENKVISIRRDAIFVVNTRIRKKKFDNVEFVAKNKYSSYYQINKCDFLYSSREDKLDIKGIDDDDLINHHDYILKELRQIFKLNEINNRSACEYLYKFADKYRKKKLPIEYYRELGSNLYRLKKIQIYGNSIGTEYANMDEIDIKWNYLNIIVPLISMIF